MKLIAGARNTIQMLPSLSTECHSCESLYFNANKCSCSGSALLSVSKHSSNFSLRHFLLHFMQFFVIIIVTPESLGERSKSEVNWKITKEKVQTRGRLSSFIWNSWHLDAALGEKFMNRPGRWKDKIKNFLTWIFKGFLTIFLPTCFAAEKSASSDVLTPTSSIFIPESSCNRQKTGRSSSTQTQNT